MPLDKNHRAMVRMFKHHNFLVRSDDSSRHFEEPARSDVTIAKGGHSFNVEFKFSDEGSFNLNNWRTNQREWALKTIHSPYEIPYWLILSVSLKRVKGKHISDKIYTPSWLIPAAVFQALHNAAVYKYNTHTIRLKIGKHHNVEMQKDNFDLSTILKKYKLSWSPPGESVYPETFGDKAGQPYLTGLYIINSDHPFFDQKGLRHESNRKRNVAVQTTNL